MNGFLESGDLVMKKKIFIGSVIFFVGVGLYFASRSTKSAVPKLAPSGVKSVQTMVVHPGPVSPKLYYQGQVLAQNRLVLISEVSAKVSANSPSFKTGMRFSKGDILIQFDDREVAYSLYALKSQFLNTLSQFIADLSIDYPKEVPAWQSYLDAFDIQSPLNPLPAPSTIKQKRFMSAKQIYKQFFDIKSLEAQLEKYQLLAPFDGEVVNADIRPLARIRSGEELGTIIGYSGYEVTLSVPPSDIRYFVTESKVITQTLPPQEGQILRVGSALSEATQTIAVVLGFQSAQLMDGQYVDLIVEGKAIPNAVRISKNSVSNGAVYGVKSDKLVLLPVKIVKEEDETVIVTGLSDGQVIVSLFYPGLYEGLEVSAL